MASFILYFFAIVLVTTLAQAAPWPNHARRGTHRTRLYRRGHVKVNSYHRKPIYKSIDHHRISPRSLSSSPEANTSAPCNATAISFVASELGIDEGTIRYKIGRFRGQEGWGYLEQTINGIPVVNTAANVRFDKACTITLLGSSLVDPKHVTADPPEPTVDCEEVLTKIGGVLDANHTGAPGDLEYYLKDEHTLELVCPVPFRNMTTSFWVEAYVSAHTGELVSLTDYAAHASYNVVPVQRQSLSAGREILVDPADPTASPDGWHIGNRTDTSGRNVVAGCGLVPGEGLLDLANESSKGLVFNFDYDENQPFMGRDAAVTNAFYVTNMMHDVAYRYGFDERAHNFEVNQNPEISDPVLVSVQDSSESNNAVFTTPPDGQSPTCKLFMFNDVNPARDSSMSNDIIIHEYTHGITNRMTGGGLSKCLQSTDAAGLGEGWSDMMAAWFAQKSADVVDFYMGSYVTQSGRGKKSQGIRRFPYSTSPEVNPLMYSDMEGRTEPHDIGEIWANTLYNVYADLVQEHGFSTKAQTDPDGLEGNIVFMRNMIGGLSNQPCNPTMVQARDAIVSADNSTYNGAHRCTILRAFARKGLGVGADDSFRDDTSVPSECDPVVPSPSAVSEYGPSPTRSLGATLFSQVTPSPEPPLPGLPTALAGDVVTLTIILES